MWEWIRAIQQKPENVRRRLALLFAAGITLLIIFMWGTLSFFAEPSFDLPERSPQSESLEALNKDLEKLKYAAEKQKNTWQEIGTLFQFMKSEGASSQ